MKATDQLETIVGDAQNLAASQALRRELEAVRATGTLYLGYPVLRTADEKVFVDALLVSPSHGLWAFDSRPMLRL
jgi:hypothetical protein